MGSPAFVKGLKDGLGGKMAIVAEAPYETTDPTIDSQIINLKASGADVFFNITTPKFASQAIRKLLSYQADADDALQRRELGAILPDHQR
jgi:hypothetical protein